MMKIQNLIPEFVEYIPEKLEEGTLYISERYRTAVHKCCCGCGREVVTPLTPADWQVRRDGNRVSLWPSIGNWGSPCRSHYVIRQNRVLAAGDMTERQVQQVKARDRTDKKKWIARTNRNKDGGGSKGESPSGNATHGIGLLDRIARWWRNH